MFFYDRWHLNKHIIIIIIIIIKLRCSIKQLVEIIFHDTTDLI